MIHKKIKSALVAVLLSCSALCTTSYSSDLTNQEEHVSDKAVIIVGPRKAGKTALYNLFLGKELKAIEEPNSGDLILQEIDNPGRNMINNIEPYNPEEGYFSEVISTYDPVKKRYIVDCPRFNSGKLEEDYKNALAIYESLKNYKYVQVALVIPEEYFKTSYAVFLLSKVVDIFSDLTECKSVFNLVVSHQSPEIEAASKILDDFRNSVLEDNGLYRSFYYWNFSEKARECFGCPEVRAVSFPKPTSSGQYVPSAELVQFINNGTYVETPKVNKPTNGISANTGWLTPQK